MSQNCVILHFEELQLGWCISRAQFHMIQTQVSLSTIFKSTSSLIVSIVSIVSFTYSKLLYHLKINCANPLVASNQLWNQNRVILLYSRSRQWTNISTQTNSTSNTLISGLVNRFVQQEYPFNWCKIAITKSSVASWKKFISRCPSSSKVRNRPENYEP